jgi:hypothetical protein
VAAKLKAALDEKQAKDDAVAAFQKELSELYQQPFPEGTAGQPLEPFDKHWARLLQCAETLTGAKGCYLAKVNPGENETISYTMAQPSELGPGHDYLLDETLAKEKGVTWQAFEPKGGDAEAAEGAEETEKAYVPLVIPDVIDVDDKLHFYDLTRLGSLVVLPMVFSDLVTEPALAEAKKFLVEKAKKEQEEEEKRKAALEAAEANPAEAPEIPPEPEPIVPTETTIPKGGEVKYALCMDTLCMAGDGEQVVKPEHIEKLNELCKAVAECKARYDHYGVWQQAAAWKEEDPAPFKTAKEAAAAKADQAIAAAKESEALKDAKEEEIVLVELENKFKSNKELLEQFKEDLLAVKKSPIVSEAAHTAVAAAALLCQMPSDQVLSRATKAPVWEKCRQVFPAIVEKVLGSTPTGPRVGLSEPQTVAFLRQLAAKVPKEEVAEEPVALQALYLWLHSALDLREQDVKIRKDRHEAQIGTEPPCDDAGILAD